MTIVGRIQKNTYNTINLILCQVPLFIEPPPAPTIPLTQKMAHTPPSPHQKDFHNSIAIQCRIILIKSMISSYFFIVLPTKQNPLPLQSNIILSQSPTFGYPKVGLFYFCRICISIVPRGTFTAVSFPRRRESIICDNKRFLDFISLHP